MSYENIPAEMRAYQQWICWRYEDKQSAKPTKVPYSPFPDANGQPKLASVSDWSTWGTFEQAVAAAPYFDGIGFVFTANDPFAGIDLDDAYELKEDGSFKNPNPDETRERQIKVYQEFNSYSELSPSGKGMHIIIKGSISQGRRRASIELYSSGRFFTMTGNVTHKVGIADKNELFHILWNQMGGAGGVLHYDGNSIETETDARILERAAHADNGDKFSALWLGNWAQYYSSQSEADLAIVNIFAFYTQNRNQITRLFQSSALGQRDKAKRQDYVDYMVNKSFDRMLPPVDIVGLTTATKLAIEGKLKPVEDHERKTSQDIPFDSDDPYTVPPGLMGEIAKFIYASSARPVREISLAAAIGLMAGVCGQAYNVSGTGLNMYILMLAETGRGKEAMANGADKLFEAIKLSVPSSKDFRGPASINSGQALLKNLASCHGSIVSIVGEFGIKMGQLTNGRAGIAESALLSVLLDMYNKSGIGRKIQPTIYSDRANSIAEFDAPGFTLLGESAPSSFYENIDERMIEGGLLPRFLMIEYQGIRVPDNKERANARVPIQLANDFGTLCAASLQLMNTSPKRAVNVKHDAEATALLHEFDVYADAQINNSNSRVLAELWNRAHMNVLRLSALVAVGCNVYDPVVTAEHVTWARGIVVSGIKKILQRFERGLIGAATEESRQVVQIQKMIQNYMLSTVDEAILYGSTLQFYNTKVIPFSYITRRLANDSAFRKDRMGSSNAIKRTLQTMIDSGTIVEIPRGDMIKNYQSTQRAFMVADMRIIS